MPSWVSVLGKWFPRLERAVNPNAEEGNEIYDGPDRAATQILNEQSAEFLGEDYRMNKDTLRQARELGYKDVNDYLKEFHGFDPVKAKEKAESILKEKVRHRNQDPKKAFVPESSGGYDTSGKGESFKGGFGDPEVIKNQKDLSKRA